MAVQPTHRQAISNPISAGIGQPAEAKELFGSDELLEFTLHANMKTLLKDRDDERNYHPATIHYRSNAGEAITVALKVRVRGKHRRDPSVCDFPPLLLNFPKTKVMHTVFAGANKVKLVTHCNSEKYVIREYLVYKLYNMLSDYSFRVRLCKVMYQDSEGRKSDEHMYAFLIEDEDDLAERSKGVILADELVIRMDATDDRAMAKLALFQYMIGNTDWSVPFRHNIRLLYLHTGSRPVPIPYDFDYTGIVMPPYAKPPPEIGITSVRQRLFRGYTFPDAVYQELVPYFNNRKTAIYAVYLECELLDRKYRKRTLKFLDEFYETINDPKDFERKIVRMGGQNEKRSVIIKGLD
ncbi:hypothetical protein D1627_17215 [Pontibacter oryzae]|uniref:Uncharacterized protein n=2 Tax=Pontibacter oryzae TaxID=2304593 RepID=A0A399RQN8_9BACT|nr:hypothetical protein D1627_17215 [Pontibacter oryzae]